MNSRLIQIPQTLSVSIYRHLPGDKRLTKTISSFVPHLNNVSTWIKFAIMPSHSTDRGIPSSNIHTCLIPTYLPTKFHSPSSNGPLASVIKLTAEQNIRTTAIIFYTLQRYYLRNAVHFSHDLSPHVTWDLKVKGASVAYQFHVSAMLLLLTAENYVVWC